VWADYDIGFVGHGGGGFAVEDRFAFFIFEDVDLPAVGSVEGLGEVFAFEGDDIFVMIGRLSIRDEGEFDPAIVVGAAVDPGVDLAEMLFAAEELGIFGEDA
jgi:hypothetical protein